MARGGRRPGAGAPKGNLNALKHGRRSRQFAELSAAIAASPTARETLLKLAARDTAHNRTADETAAYIIGEVLRRGLVRGHHRLIALPETLDGRSINDFLHPGEENPGNGVPTINRHTRKSTGNQTLDRKKSVQNAYLCVICRAFPPLRLWLVSLTMSAARASARSNPTINPKSSTL